MQWLNRSYYISIEQKREKIENIFAKYNQKESFGICERFLPFRFYALRYNWTKTISIMQTSQASSKSPMP
ncbi:hypothetical protein DRQ29_03105 [bacterium]|nr:MAG: hypothetical protein DRQ29_03105 [bacterium]